MHLEIIMLKYSRNHELVAVAVGAAKVDAAPELIGGKPVNKQLHAELTLVGWVPQLLIYVGMALVAVTTLSRYVVQKAEADDEYWGFRRLRRQLLLYCFDLSVELT